MRHILAQNWKNKPSLGRI